MFLTDRDEPNLSELYTEQTVSCAFVAIEHELPIRPIARQLNPEPVDKKSKTEHLDENLAAHLTDTEEPKAKQFILLNLPLALIAPTAEHELPIRPRVLKLKLDPVNIDPSADVPRWRCPRPVDLTESELPSTKQLSNEVPELRPRAVTLT